MVQNYYQIYESELFERSGHSFRLLIYSKHSGTRLKIGNLVDIRLQLQGNSSDIDAPIIKTSLSWTVADEQDKGVVGVTRYGHWEGLYTSDATMFRVVLERDGEAAWTGYLTPDSWNEGLQHNSYMTFTARDNIGHLQDFEYDDYPVEVNSEGTVTVQSLLYYAMELIAFHMDIEPYEDNYWLMGGSSSIADALVDPKVFSGKDWYTIIESLLSTCGVVMRYIGSNTVWVGPLRYLPTTGRTTKYGDLVNRSGQRTLDPAYKAVAETGNYELADPDVPTFTADDWYQLGGVGEYIFRKAGWSDSSNDSYMTQQYTDEIREAEAASEVDVRVADASFDRYLMLRIGRNKSEDHWVQWTKAMDVGVSATLKLSADNTYELFQDQWGMVDTYSDAWDIKLYISFRKNTGGVIVYYDDANGVWSTDSDTEPLTFDPRLRGGEDITVSLPAFPDAGQLYVKIVATSSYSDPPFYNHIFYVRLGKFSLAVDSAGLPRRMLTTTYYDSKQNRTLRRNADFVIVPDYIKGPGVIKNALYWGSVVNGTRGVNKVKWGTGTELPLPVFVHLQHIAYHSQANSIFSGELRDPAENITFAEKWSIYGKTCLLVGGSLNLMTGRVENAKIVEYVPYDTLFGNITAADVDYKNEQSYTGGRGGGSSFGGGGGGRMDHYHTNKVALDKIEYDEDNNALFAGDEDDAVGLYVFGDIVAGGLGGLDPPTSGEVASIYLGEEQYTPDDDGIIHLPAYPTSAEWGNITGDLADQEDLTAALAGKLSTAGGILTGALLVRGGANTTYIELAFGNNITRISDNDSVIAHDLEIGNDLIVVHNSSVGGDLTITRNISAGGNITVTGAVSVSGDITTSGKVGIGSRYIRDAANMLATPAMRIDNFTTESIEAVGGIVGVGNINMLANGGNLTICAGGGGVTIGTVPSAMPGKLRVGGDIYTSGAVGCESLRMDGVPLLSYTEDYVDLDSYWRPLYIMRTHWQNVVMCMGGGKTGIGVVPTEKLEVSGNIKLTGEVISGSDRRIKENITNISDNPIMQLHPCEWDWKDREGHSAGLIAQEVAEVIPFAVRGSEQDGYALAYNIFHAYEIKALQEHEVRLQALEKSLKA